MIEARIECLCGSYTLSDLGFALTKGQIVYMDAPKARGSQDLQRAWRVKAVAIKYVERYQERREVPANNPVFPSPPGMPAFVPEAPPGADVLLVDPDEIAARVVEVLSRSPINERVQIEVGRQVQALEERLIARVTASVMAAFRAEYPAGMPVVTGSSQPLSGRVQIVEDDVPVFVPSRIGDAELDVDLGLQPSKTGEAVVSDAAAALRAARGAGKKRTE